LAEVLGVSLNAPGRRIPLALKVVYTLFMLVLVPVYWVNYGPTNFLYFCDMSLFLTMAAIWLESPLLAAIPAVGLFLPQLFWVFDFLGGCVGHSITGMTDYMFDSGIPLYARGLSSFHGWLPFLLLWLVWRLGYDRRALVLWTTLSWALMLISYFFLPMPPVSDPNVPVNVNYVFGLSDKEPQHWMAHWQWLVLLMLALPIVFYVPTHFFFAYLFPPKTNAEVQADSKS
jgi:hypothetical protein